MPRYLWRWRHRLLRHLLLLHHHYELGCLRLHLLRHLPYHFTLLSVLLLKFLHGQLDALIDLAALRPSDDVGHVALQLLRQALNQALPLLHRGLLGPDLFLRVRNDLVVLLRNPIDLRLQRLNVALLLQAVKTLYRLLALALLALCLLQLSQQPRLLLPVLLQIEHLRVPGP